MDITISMVVDVEGVYISDKNCFYVARNTF